MAEGITGASGAFKVDYMLAGFERAMHSFRTIPVDRRVGAFLGNAGLLVRSLAQTKAPRNVGLLAGSIRERVDNSDPPRFVEIGSNVHYAPYMEFGTGLVHDHPSWPRKRHAPFARIGDEVSAVPGLIYWAGRKGIGRTPEAGGYMIARAIYKRGGLKPRRFLRDALQQAMPSIAEAWGNVARSLAGDMGSQGGSP